MRYRNMISLSGLPGWLRFGFSPGRGGRGPGPCARFLLTGLWPVPPIQDPQTADIDQVAILQNQAAVLEQQLQQINARIAELEQK